MKVIDLLNKIANGEKLPETIKYRSGIYHKFNQSGYFYAKSWEEETLLDNIQCTSDLTEKIEIIDPIEEDKEIEEISINENGTLGFPNGNWTARNMDKAFAYKINQLVKALKELKKGK